PAPAPAPAPGAAANCVNTQLAVTVGTVSRINYQYIGPINGTAVSVSTVRPLTTYEGQSVYEQFSTVEVTGTTTAGGFSSQIVNKTEGSSYYNRQSATELPLHGSFFTNSSRTTLFGITSDAVSTVKTVINPPFTDPRFGLAVGQSASLTYPSTSTVTILQPSGQPPTTTTVQAKFNVRFVGIESVTVPAGTYSTCRFEQVDPDSPNNTTTQWYSVNQGVAVKQVSVTPEGTQTLNATLVQINGTNY
ncbi:MAG: hypothetical protein ABIN96_08945, partial [Rubrivivax sp.]